MTNILVTGATGFIGSHLARQLSKGVPENRVVILIRDWVPMSWFSDSLSACTVIFGDLRNREMLFRAVSEYDIEHIYHLAAQSIVRRAQNNPFETFQSNIMGTVAILEAVRQSKTVKHVLVQSTDKVYGECIAATEDSPFGKVLEPYATSKMCTDLIAQSYQATYGLPITISRPCNIYGYDPRGARIIPNTIKQCIQGVNPTIYEEPKDRPSRRQYLYIDDLVEALTQLMKFIPPARIFNITSNEDKTQEEVVLEILKHFPDLRPMYQRRAGGFAEITAGCIASQNPFGWGPKIRFNEGIAHTVDMFRRYRW